MAPRASSDGGGEGEPAGAHGRWRRVFARAVFWIFWGVMVAGALRWVGHHRWLAIDRGHVGQLFASAMLGLALVLGGFERSSLRGRVLAGVGVQLPLWVGVTLLFVSVRELAVLVESPGLPATAAFLVTRELASLATLAWSLSLGLAVVLLSRPRGARWSSSALALSLAGGALASGARALGAGVVGGSTELYAGEWATLAERLSVELAVIPVGNVLIGAGALGALASARVLGPGGARVAGLLPFAGVVALLVAGVASDRRSGHLLAPPWEEFAEFEPIELGNPDELRGTEIDGVLLPGGLHEVGGRLLSGLSESTLADGLCALRREHDAREDRWRRETDVANVEEPPADLGRSRVIPPVSIVFPDGELVLAIDARLGARDLRSLVVAARRSDCVEALTVVGAGLVVPPGDAGEALIRSLSVGEALRAGVPGSTTVRVRVLPESFEFEGRRVDAAEEPLLSRRDLRHAWIGAEPPRVLSTRPEVSLPEECVALRPTSGECRSEDIVRFGVGDAATAQSAFRTVALASEHLNPARIELIPGELPGDPTLRLSAWLAADPRRASEAGDPERILATLPAARRDGYVARVVEGSLVAEPVAVWGLDEQERELPPSPGAAFLATFAAALPRLAECLALDPERETARLPVEVTLEPVVEQRGGSVRRIEGDGITPLVAGCALDRLRDFFGRGDTSELVGRFMFQVDVRRVVAPE